MVLALDMGKRTLLWPSSSCAPLHRVESTESMHTLLLNHLVDRYPQTSCLNSSVSTYRILLGLFLGSLLPRVNYATLRI